MSKYSIVRPSALPLGSQRFTTPPLLLKRTFSQQSYLLVYPSTIRYSPRFFPFPFCVHAPFLQPLIDLIDSRCVINKRFYRDSCVRRDGDPSTSVAGAVGGETAATAAAAPAGSETVKDLRVVGSEHFPLRTVLVDNQPKTVVQQANVLPVRSWFPRDSEDRQLLDLLPVLLALTSCQDVRSVLGLRPAVGGGC